jgi:hypothetical protein
MSANRGTENLDNPFANKGEPDSTNTGPPNQTNFVGSPNGFVSIIPNGASGPYSTSSPGSMYIDGQGGYNLHDNVTSVRIMDAFKNHEARTVYMNQKGQGVDWKTGRTLSTDDPNYHLYHDKK